MSRPEPVLLASQLVEILCRAVTSLTPLQSAAGAFLADPHRTDPYPATPQDITLNRAIYALAQLPAIDDPLNAYFDDAGLRERAIRVGAYLAEAIGDTGGIAISNSPADRITSGVSTSGLHSFNFWTCPHTVRYWLRATQALSTRLSDPQKSLWRDGMHNCVELLAGRTNPIHEWRGIDDPRAPRLGAAAATAAALVTAGHVLNDANFSREGETLWRDLLKRLLQSGADASIVDGLDIDALLGLLNAVSDSSNDARNAETRLARWRARLTMPDGAINELFDRQRAYTRFGMAAAVPALARHGYTAAAGAIVDSFFQRPRRGNQALTELSLLLETIEALLPPTPPAATAGEPPSPSASAAAAAAAQASAAVPAVVRLSSAAAMLKLQEQEFGWFGGEASRAWLFRGNGWIAGCRAPIACAAGFSNPWSVRHLRTPCWIDGSAPDTRRLPPFDAGLHAVPATDAAKRTLAVHGDGFHGRFGLNVIDAETIRLHARIHWALPISPRAPAAVQVLLQQKEGDRILIRDPAGHTVEILLALEAVQQELPAGAQLELPGGDHKILLAVQSSFAPPILRWNMPARPGADRLPAPPGRLELLLPIAGGQETRLDLTLSVPR